MVGAGYNGPQGRQDRFQGHVGGEADLRAVEALAKGLGAILSGKGSPRGRPGR